MNPHAPRRFHLLNLPPHREGASGLQPAVSRIVEATSLHLGLQGIKWKVWEMPSVLIVSRVRIHRGGFHSLLKDADGITVVGGCRIEEAPDHACATKPDVVLLDVTTSPEPAMIQSIVGAWPPVRIIVVGVEDSDQEILFWMEHGASHFVTAEAEGPDLVSAISEAALDETRWPTRISRLLLKRVQELAKAESTTVSPPRLTRRQLEILGLLNEGCSIKEVGLKLSIESSTVKGHMHRILRKARVHNRFDALARFKTEINSRN